MVETGVEGEVDWDDGLRGCQVRVTASEGSATQALGWVAGRAVPLVRARFLG